MRLNKTWKNRGSTIGVILSSVFLASAANAITPTDISPVQIGNYTLGTYYGIFNSGDGSLVVGTAYSSDYLNTVTVKYNSTDGITVLDDGATYRGDRRFNAGATSFDGSVIVGSMVTNNVSRAFVYRNGVGVSYLDGYDANYTSATDSTYANHVSSNGSVIGGYMNVAGNSRAIKYTASAGLEYLDGLGVGATPTTSTYISQMSENGDVIYCSDTVYGSPTVSRLFKYIGGTSPNVYLDGLTTAPTSFLWESIWAISKNGSVAIGEVSSNTWTLGTRAFKYTDASGMVFLDGLSMASDPTVASFAKGISDNGDVIGGMIGTWGTMRAFKYNSSNQMVYLDGLGANATPTFETTVSTNCVSGNGNVIAGNSYGGPFTRVYKYTDDKGLVFLDGASGSDTPAFETYLTSGCNALPYISWNGDAITGNMAKGNVTHAFKYTDATGVLDLGALGTHPATNNSSALSISPDGNLIYGLSYDDSGAQHLVLWSDFTNTISVIDYAAWMGSITGANSVSAMTTSLGITYIEGAHHRTMMSYDNLGKKNQVWITGDFASSARTSDSNTTTGEAGVSTTLADGLVGGIAAGYGAQNTNLPFDGSSAVKGNFVIGEVDYLLPDKQSVFSVLASYGKWNAETYRGYSVGGGNTDYSAGLTDVYTYSLRLKLDGPNQVIATNLTLAPFISMSWSQTKVNAYTENGGALPASFDAQSHTASEGRMGVTSSYNWSETTKFILSAELIHRFDNKPTLLSGTDLTGSVPFATSGAAPVRNQSRFGLDVDQRLDADTLLNFSVHFAGLGASPDVQGALTLRRAF